MLAGRGRCIGNRKTGTTVCSQEHCGSTVEVGLSENWVHDHFPYEDSHMEVIGLYQMNVVNPTKKMPNLGALY